MSRHCRCPLIRGAGERRDYCKDIKSILFFCGVNSSLLNDRPILDGPGVSDSCRARGVSQDVRDRLLGVKRPGLASESEASCVLSGASWVFSWGSEVL